MQTYASAFERELANLIEQRKKDLVEKIARGLVIDTMEKYREHVGRIMELDEVLEMFATAHDTVSKKR